MFNELILGTLLVTTTVIIHAIIHEQLIHVLEWLAPILGRRLKRLWKIPTIVVAVMGTLTALILEMWMWALFFMATGEPAVNTIESALYFSASTFTTLGLGDIVLGHQWRLLGSFEATNGLLLFGWSTAFLFEVIRDLYSNDRIIAFPNNNIMPDENP